ncbi:MAG: hypothetical protein LBU51_08370 [Bacteroidales bacterium]|jgi:hypothetical protein|nr:hypothetical protein [Bacteroidales bacterium]
MKENFVQYQDNENLYYLNESITDSIAKSIGQKLDILKTFLTGFLDPFGNTINQGIQYIFSGASTLKEQNTQREKLNLDFIFNSDKLGYTAEEKYQNILTIVVVAILIIYFLKSKK